MKTPYEFYKEIHPDQFSDSRDRLNPELELSREMFDYFLETLTSKNLEKSFEVFCRKLAEREICPNLIVQTGPTGGGDSKVDTETYPVSDSIALAWYSGLGRDASSEKWAFAISAKREWRSKIRSDVQKIVKTNRGYKHVFFMTNQNIPDKKRAEMEDELTANHGIEVHILDRNWITTKLFDGKHEAIAVESFGLSPRFADSIEEGANDLRRRRKMEDLDRRIQITTGDNSDVSVLPELALESAILSRELERPVYETKGRFDRALNLAKAYGTEYQIKECLYQWAWCSYWWHMDFEEFYLRYCDYESFICGKATIYDIERLTNLWMNLHSVVQGDPEARNLQDHTETLKKEYDLLMSDEMKPNTALQAKANFVTVRLLLGGDVDEAVNELTAIIKEGETSLSFDFLTLKRIIMELPLFQKAKNYDELFELLITISSKRKLDVEAAELLVDRSEQLYEDKPYTAIRYLGRAIVKLGKDETKHILAKALLLMGRILEHMGLCWAARGYYLNSFHISINHYFSYGKLYPSLVGSLNALKYLELSLGRLIHSVEFHKLEQISLHLYRGSNPDSVSSETLSEKSNYDYILGIQAFRTRFSDLSSLTLVPTYFRESGLELSAVAMKYCLGHADEDLLKSFDGNKDAMEDFLRKWYNQPARHQLVASPWYGNTGFCVLSSKVLGCEITIKSELPFPCVEISESILAALEAFLSTGIIDRLVCYIPEIEINVTSAGGKGLSFEIQKETDTSYVGFNITCSSFPDANTVHVQEQVKEFVFRACAEILSSMVTIDLSLKTLENMVSRDHAFNRAFDFTGSTAVMFEYFGRQTPHYQSIEVQDDCPCQLVRSVPLDLAYPSEPDPCENNAFKERTIIRGTPPDYDIEKTKQSEIKNLKVINAPLWDKAQWKGVLFLRSPDADAPPVLSPIYADSTAGKAIFRQWIEMAGTVDESNLIDVGIIRGVDKTNPYHYRVAFMPNENTLGADNMENAKLVIAVTRCLTLEASTDRNLRVFMDAFRHLGEFIMCPSQMQENGQPKLFTDLSIVKQTARICDAWQVKANSFLASAILPDDDPIIPKDIVNAPVVEVLRMKRESGHKDNSG